ncbi:uncharacterized protein VICG_00586 [Vittaforma corneae ATCC 50505]|uniref:L-type lectin-like domain-containing protein n=1 Tax=Vittaforma corneae (strain ATCC 50505) TaxID=993615 RepID=L2GQ83_VITCO|nr:uncharacterized protein VICG_00586 [Vittaforma corneae ATCC 50505]ELA42487.1 hypothetical protein VICG_00586 [Vittaforma corneae ATCC 50505]
MLGLFLNLVGIFTENIKNTTNNNDITESVIDEISFIPHVYNDRIGIQNVMVKPDKLFMRSTIDESAMVRWEIQNPQNNWSFTFEFNELNLESRESAGIFLFYTKEKPVIGSFKGGPSKFHGFAVGLEFVGKGVELVYAKNDGIDYTNMDEYVSVIDSLNPKRFSNLETLKLKVICTDKNFKVEIYDGDTVIYDNFRFFTKDYLEFAKGGSYLSLFADYKHVSSGKAFELRNAQLYHREETPDYSVTKVNMQKITTQVKPKSEIKHPNVDVQDLLFKINAVISYTKAVIGELPETSIIKAEKELIKEVDSLSEKVGKMKTGVSGRTNRNDLDGKINQLDVQLKRLSKIVNDVDYLTESTSEVASHKYHLILEYFVIFSGIFAVSVMFIREMRNFIDNRKHKLSINK